MKERRVGPDGGALGLLRAVARIAVVAGAMGSVGFMLRAGRSTPRLLLVLFVIWVLSPFGALGWANGHVLGQTSGRLPEVSARRWD